MREGPEFVLWFLKYGVAVVLFVLAVSVGLFWWLARWSRRQARENDERIRRSRQP